MSGQSPDRSTVSAVLAARLMRPVGAEDRVRAAWRVLDWIGCAIAGARYPAARAMARAAEDMGAGAEILHWSALGSILEMDDVDKRALLHPGAVVIPAALAVAAAAGGSGRDVLDAITRGYEAMIRVGRAVGPDHYRYWHNTATCGPFGAAAAAASLLDLDTDKTAQALGLAGTQASGFWQMRNEPQSHAKQLHTAHAAHSGCLAARLVAMGFVGLTSLFEGPQGFFAATCGAADPRRVVDFDAASPWTIHDVSFKPWPSCRHAHAAIDAALALRSAGVDAGAVERGVIRVYRDAVVFCDNSHPGDALSARFSLQHAVATALFSGAPALADFEGEGLVRRDVAVLRARLEVAEDQMLSERYPARFGAGLDLLLKDGTRRSIEIGDALGDPENPAAESLMRSKADMLMRSAGLTARRSETLAARALALAEGGEFGEFLGALREGLAA